MLPKDDNPNKKFKMPYINGNFILPFLTSLFISYFWKDLLHVLTNFGNVDYKAYLFLIFVILAILMTAYTVLKQWSLIPVLGVLCCLYLMIEIPVKSWAVFFGWMTLGLCIYFGYSFKRSNLA
jgi:hypothetical protein